MAIYNLSQGVLSNPGTSGDDTFYVPITRTITTAFLSGAYTIDANASMMSVGGNDTLTFKATNLFTGGNYLFLPQFELINGNPTWIAYDQRAVPFSVSWPNFGSGDKVNLEIWNTTPESPTNPILVARSEGSVTNITSLGQATTGYSQAFHVAQTQTTFTQYLDGVFWDTDEYWAGSYYVVGSGYLAQNEASSPARLVAQQGSGAVDLGGGLSNYIYNQVKSSEGSFYNGSPYKSVNMEIHIDANALTGGRSYLELIGSIGTNEPAPNTYNQYNSNFFTNRIPDVKYDIYVDSSSQGSLTVHETDTGVRNWSDQVRYSDYGITATGVTGQVNTGSANNYGAGSTNGITLNTGLFNSDGSQTVKATISSVNGGANWITLSNASGSFVVGDKVYLSGLGVNYGELSDGNVYKVLEVGAPGTNQVKLAYADGFTTTAINPSGLTGYGAATLQKINDYDFTVVRGSATDVFAGVEHFELTTGNDVINFGGVADHDWTTVLAGKGSDTWNLFSTGSWGTLSIQAFDGPGSLSGITNGLAVNLSGSTKGFNSPTGYKTLDAASVSFDANGTRTFTGSMLDEYGFTDTFNIKSGGQYTDSQGINFQGTTASDRYYFAVDGLGTIGEYYINGNAGYDQIFLLDDATGATSKNLDIRSTNFTKTGGVESVSIEGYARFSQTADYEVSFETVNIGQTQTKLAKITQVAAVTGSTTDTLNVANVSDWSVGDVVTFRSSSVASLGANLVAGTSYRIREVTAGTGLKLEALDGTAITTLTGNANLTGVSIERLVDTGVVEKNYITFGDAAGDFSRLAFQYDGSLLDTTKFAFRVNASDVLPTVGLGTDFGSMELSQNEKLANLVLDYRDLYDNLDPFTSGSIYSKGIQYFNGLVDKGVLGFDRLVDYQDSDVVGQRHFSMTDNDDVITQSAGSSALELKFSANGGQDKIFVDGRSDDANQRIEINLGPDPWNNGSDGSLDTVEIGLSSLNKNYKSVQYIDITNADRSDVIRFVDAEGYTVQLENSRAVGAAPATSYKNYVTYNVYQGDAAASNLVMTVRVGSFQSWGNTASDQFSSSNGETVPLETMWGSVTSLERSISGSAPAVAQTAGNDSAIIFEDRSSSINPYFMGAGDDYIVSMGGDQDIALGAGNDYISVRNSGQQMFISGGAGTDSIGLSGFFTTLSDGSYVSDQWSFSSMDVNKAKAVMTAKYPNLSTATDPFEWSTTALDRVMVATNRLDGTALFFQAEKLSFSNGSVDSEYFLPPINETYDLTLANTAAITLYGRATNDTINLKVDDVDQALKYVGSWLDAKNTSLVTTGNTLLGTHTLSINAQTAATSKWFSNTYTNAGINLVDVENIRLFDSAGRDVTVRVAGSSAYESVSEAVAYANRGDVIFVAETVQGALTGTTRATVNMDTTVSVASGLRVAFEEGASRTVNTTAQLTVNMTEEVKSSASNNFLGMDSHVLELLGTANINVNGSSGADIIIGNKGNNVINGLAGDDLIFGGNGSDMIIGGLGDDALIGGSSHKASAIANFAGENWSLFNASTDSFTTMDPQALEFKTGDKLIYTATGGTGVLAYIGGVATNLTSSTALYAIRTDNVDGSATFKLASSQANAMNGVFIDVVSNGTATSHAFTIDNVAYTAANLPGNDYLYGGSGNDHLVATGVMGSLTTAGVRDTLTMNGGSGADTLTVLSNTGLINAFGGSGSDKFEVMDSFMDAVGVNKAERIVDFSATQDDVQSYFALADLGAVSVESRLNAGGVTLSQLVAPPLPIVSGSGENGNYQAISDQVNSTYSLPDFGLNVADLINLHNAHAA